MTSKKTEQKITIKQNEQNPEPMEIIANSIIEISIAVKKLNSSRLQPRVIKLLIKDICGISMTDIDQVLGAIALLEKTYIKQSK